jgi:hypothetical protein
MSRRRVALLVSTLASCLDHPLATVELDTHQQMTRTTCMPDPPKVDVLLVIDDSASMASFATRIAENLGHFANVYDRADRMLDYRIAVTTTDVTHPACASRPEDGALVSTSCRSRMDDFTAARSHESEPVDVGSACADHCTLDAIPFLPSATEFDDELRPRPWIERARGRHNLPDGITPADALPCLGQVGVAGCTFESPLEAAKLALMRSFDADDPAYGFIRHDAALFVLFLTNEGDCSVRPEHADIFDPAGDRVFWPDDVDEATSAVCWNAGVECSGGPGVYDDCVEVDHDASGAPSSSDSAVLRPLDRYLEFLREIEADKQRANATNAQLVFTSVVGGVPIGYETGMSELVFMDSPDPVVQSAFGIGPGCVDSSMDPPGTAFPPTRLREIVAEFGEEGEWSVVSVAQQDYSIALACVPGTPRWPLPCFNGCAADRDPTTPELEPQCTISVQKSSDAEPTTLPPCVQSCDGDTCRELPEWNSWEVPPGADACVLWRVGDAREEQCIQEGFNLGYRILRRDGVWEGSCTEITCMVSNDPNLDCPDL